MKPKIPKALENLQPETPRYLSDFDISEPPPASSIQKKAVQGALNILPEQKSVEISVEKKESSISPELIKKIMESQASPKKQNSNQSSNPLINTSNNIQQQPLDSNMIPNTYSQVTTAQTYQYPPQNPQYPQYPQYQQQQQIFNQYNMQTMQPPPQPMYYNQPYPYQQPPMMPPYPPPPQNQFNSYANIPPFKPYTQQQQPQQQVYNEPIPQQINENQKPPVEEEEEKPRMVNFHHGNQKPFSITFHFGTNEKFIGYRKPDTRFTLPTFKLSRPILIKNDNQAPPATIMNPIIYDINSIAKEICTFPAHLYKVTRDERENKEKYVDDGFGTIALKCVNNEQYILTLSNDSKYIVTLRLLKGVKPRIKQDSFIQVLANEFSDSKTPSIYLIKCQNSIDAQQLSTKIQDSVT